MNEHISTACCSWLNIAKFDYTRDIDTGLIIDEKARAFAQSICAHERIDQRDMRCAECGVNVEQLMRMNPEYLWKHQAKHHNVVTWGETKPLPSWQSAKLDQELAMKLAGDWNVPSEILTGDPEPADNPGGPAVAGAGNGVEGMGNAFAKIKDVMNAMDAALSPYDHLPIIDEAAGLDPALFKMLKEAKKIN